MSVLFLFFLIEGYMYLIFFFFSSRRRHTRWNCDWSSDVCSSDLDVGRYREQEQQDRDDLLARRGVCEPAHGKRCDRRAEESFREPDHDRHRNADVRWQPFQHDNHTRADDPSGRHARQRPSDGQQEGHDDGDQGNEHRGKDDREREIECVAESGLQIQACEDDARGGCGERSTYGAAPGFGTWPDRPPVFGAAIGEILPAKSRARAERRVVRCRRCCCAHWWWSASLSPGGEHFGPLKEPEPGSGLRAPAPRAREGARRHADHPRPGGIPRRAPEESWAAVVPWSRGGWRGAGPRPRRAPGAVSEVPARHRGGGSGKSEDLTNALIVLLDEPSYATGAAAGAGGDVVVVGPGRASPSLRLMINRGRNGMKTRTSAVVPALSHTSW